MLGEFVSFSKWIKSHSLIWSFLWTQTDSIKNISLCLIIFSFICIYLFNFILYSNNRFPFHPSSLLPALPPPQPTPIHYFQQVRASMGIRHSGALCWGRNKPLPSWGRGMEWGSNSLSFLYFFPPPPTLLLSIFPSIFFFFLAFFFFDISVPRVLFLQLLGHFLFEKQKEEHKVLYGTNKLPY